MYRINRLVLSAVLVIIGGCAGSSVGTAPSDADTIEDAGSDVEQQDRAGEDSPKLDGLMDWSPDLGWDGVIPGCEPGMGCAGDPCEESKDCLSGWCVDHMGESVCTDTCVEDCPSGWSCQQVGTETDMVFICVSDHPSLCMPCAMAADCAGTGGVQIPCVSYGDEGFFCGGACDEDGDCPDSFVCQEVETISGATLTQCVSEDGICECTDKSIALGLSTPCGTENAFGLCQGFRTCTEEGLSVCDASVPGPETCNGVDDDCDGSTDEDTCDDMNLCTEDVCNGPDGCEHVSLGGVECMDDDLCTIGDHCDAGVCVGVPVDCDDGNPCTDDSCDPATGSCEHTDNTLPCDDQDPCTVADECLDGACVGVAIDCDCVIDQDCGKLEDGDLCNGTLYCNTSISPHLCQVDLETLIECPEPEGADAPCLAPSCDPDTGECGFAEDNEGFPCQDEDLCTVADSCEKGECVGGVDANCNDGNPCTDDTCMPESGCQHAPNQDPCEDGDVCTVGDQCDGGECVHGGELSCDDDDVCTNDSCDSSVGCVYEPNEAPCDDLNFCTESDTCVGGVCTPGKGVDCNDGDVCTEDSCDPLLGCVHANNTSPCDDADPCTQGDVCGAGTCTGVVVDCDDGKTCTDDSCDPFAGCVHTDNTASCDDGNLCTEGDTCGGGVCQPGLAVNCDDNNVCTDDSCTPLGGCLNLPNTAPCTDGDVCTLGDLCAEGGCVSGVVLNCDDNNVCTDDSCDPFTGCVHLANSVPCNDQNTCTISDTCVDGLCLGEGSLDCDDGNPCTKDICLPDGGCAHEDLSGVPCSDQDPCTLDDSCDQGECVPGEVLDCDDGNPCTDDSCAEGGGCSNLPNIDPCDDGNACTTGDTCGGGTCGAGLAIPCDDGNICTTDSCDPVTGCLFDPNSHPCDDGDACTTGDTCAGGSCLPTGGLGCDDGNVCTTDSCDPLAGCLHAANTLPCDDGNACTTGETCGGKACLPGAAVDCDDGNVCTTDSCAPTTGCVNTDNSLPCNDGDICTTGDVCSGGICAGTGILPCDDGNVCTTDSCDENTGCKYQDNTLACDDNNDCTTGDVCAGGVCGGTGSQDCDDGNPCTLDACLLDGGCTHQATSGACDDGDPCTVNDACVDGACVSGAAQDCDDGNICTDDSCDQSGTCQNVANSLGCDDGNVCTQNDTCAGGLCQSGLPMACDDGNVCTTDSCEPATGCVNTNNTAPCNDGDVCTTTDLCSGGVCVGSGSLNCNDGNVCTTDSCDPATGCAFSFNSASCDDGNACTTGDSCSGGVCVSGGATNCNDGDPCTDDSCAPATGCVHEPNGAPGCGSDHCKTVNGVQWCYNPNACGQPCNAVCAALGMTISLSNSAWFNAQDSQAECQAISQAFGLGSSVNMSSYTYACMEDGYGTHAAPGGINSLLHCSTYSDCPSQHRTNMDQNGVPCGSDSRRSICPCQ